MKSSKQIQRMRSLRQKIAKGLSGSALDSAKSQLARIEGEITAVE